MAGESGSVAALAAHLIEAGVAEARSAPPDWGAAAQRIGAEPPADYRALLDKVVAPFSAKAFYQVLDPFAQDDPINDLAAAQTEFRVGYAEGRAAQPASYPRPDWPADGALYVWASAPGGDAFLAWEKRGDGFAPGSVLVEFSGAEQRLAGGVATLLSDIFLRGGTPPGYDVVTAGSPPSASAEEPRSVDESGPKAGSPTDPAPNPIAARAAAEPPAPPRATRLRRVARWLGVAS